MIPHSDKTVGGRKRSKDTEVQNHDMGNPTTRRQRWILPKSSVSTQGFSLEQDASRRALNPFECDQTIYATSPLSNEHSGLPQNLTGLSLPNSSSGTSSASMAMLSSGSAVASTPSARDFGPPLGNSLTGSSYAPDSSNSFLLHDSSNAYTQPQAPFALPWSNVELYSVPNSQPEWTAPLSHASAYDSVTEHSPAIDAQFHPFEPDSSLHSALSSHSIPETVSSMTQYHSCPSSNPQQSGMNHELQNGARPYEPQLFFTTDDEARSFLIAPIGLNFEGDDVKEVIDNKDAWLIKLIHMMVTKDHLAASAISRQGQPLNAAEVQYFVNWQETPELEISMLIQTEKGSKTLEARCRLLLAAIIAIHERGYVPTDFNLKDKANAEISTIFKCSHRIDIILDLAAKYLILKSDIIDGRNIDSFAAAPRHFADVKQKSMFNGMRRKFQDRTPTQRNAQSPPVCA